MLDLRESIAPPTPRSFDPAVIDEASDADLDQLPFGVIGLDPDGTILRYNLYESRLARLDRNQVLGRRFFVEVAPCARGEAFEGRYRAAVATGRFGSLDRFPYVFDFRFGAQEVEIEIARPSNGAGRYYLFINRKRVAEARRDVPEEVFAPLQGDLAPDEREDGVRRDELERRVVEVPWNMLASLRATFDRLAPESWSLFCAEWGAQWGRRAAVDLETLALERHGRALREISMRAVSGLVDELLSRQGWGRTTFDFSHVGSGLLAIELTRSALAESSSRSTQRGEGELACALLAGCYGALLGHVAGRRLAGREVACRAAGASVCSFLVVAHPRRGDVDRVLATGVRGVAAVRAALARARQGTAP